MEKTTKILIIICVVLIAAFGVTVGLLLGNHLNTPLVVNNSTNLSVNSTPTNSTQSNNTQTSAQNGTQEGNVLISPSEAEDIANNNVQSEGLTAIGAQLMNGPTKKYYQIKLAKENNLTILVAYCDIDATTGEYLGSYA